MYGHGLKSSRRSFLHLLLPAGASMGLANYVLSRRLATSAVKRSHPRGGSVKTGLDVLAQEQFAPLAGKRIGIITNHSGLTRDRRRNIDAIYASGTVKLVTIFTPEHGLTGLRDDPNIASTVDQPTGVPVRSLFEGSTRRLTPEMLRNVDVLIYDIQDIGARFYTFVTTLGYGLEATAQARIPYYVLDRPNPINGQAVEGPLLDEKYISFVGYMRMPVRHGMTIGELARFYNGEKKLGADLHVIPMENWQRRMWFDETGLEWVNPSPAIRNLTEAILYPGTCLLEGPQVSVGRGTDTPFQIIGAPWFRAREVAEYLNNFELPGVSFIPRRFTPSAYLFKDRECAGLDIQLLNRDALGCVRMGLELLHATLKFHPERFDLDLVMRLLGNDDVATRLKRGENGSQINGSLQKDLAEFHKLRNKYLLYP